MPTNPSPLGDGPDAVVEAADTYVGGQAKNRATRNWQLGCNAVRDSRSASGGLSTDYTATTANCSAQFTIR